MAISESTASGMVNLVPYEWTGTAFRKLAEGWEWDGTQWVKVFTSGVEHAPQTFSYTSSTVVTVPDWCRYVDVIALGGGGGGGGWASEGGRAGEWATAYEAVNPGSSLSLSIGSGGAGYVPGTQGGPGTNTSVTVNAAIVASAAGGGYAGNSERAGEDASHRVVHGETYSGGVGGEPGTGGFNSPPFKGAPGGVGAGGGEGGFVAPSAYYAAGRGGDGKVWIRCYDYHGYV